jgi:hypothetical protein
VFLSVSCSDASLSVCQNVSCSIFLGVISVGFSLDFYASFADVSSCFLNGMHLFHSLVYLSVYLCLFPLLTMVLSLADICLCVSVSLAQNVCLFIPA